MKKLLFLSLCFLLACGGYKVMHVTFPDGFKIKVDIADTPEKTEKGLMFREKLAHNRGMLFIFSEDAPRVFWMKNTFLPLDIIFISSDKEITSISANVPRSYPDTPEHQVAIASGFGTYVLEVPSGTAEKHGISAGDILDFNI